MIEILLFLIVMAIIIIGEGKYWKFDPKGGILRKVRTKKEEELEKSWEEIEEEEKGKEEGEKEIQVVKDTPVFLVDEIPLSFVGEPKFLRQKDHYEKWRFFEIADYVEEDIKTIYALIVQGKTPIVKRVDDRGQYLWLARKKEFDEWIQRYKEGEEG